MTAGRVDAVIAAVERHNAWRPVAEAAGVLLTLLGLDRYAGRSRDRRRRLRSSTRGRAHPRRGSPGFERPTPPPASGRQDRQAE